MKFPVHEAVKPIIWLIGKWISVKAVAKYPSMKEPMNYSEYVDIFSIGQPMLNYNSYSWHAVKQTPIHLESGFFHVKPGANEVALVIAQNMGTTFILQGSADEDKTLQLKSKCIGRASFINHPEIHKTERYYSINANNQLEYLHFMETVNTPLTKHLEVTYQLVDEKEYASRRKGQKVTKKK